jgi:phosphonate transport system substrate-binding protein
MRKRQLNGRPFSDIWTAHSDLPGRRETGGSIDVYGSMGYHAVNQARCKRFSDSDNNLNAQVIYMVVLIARGAREDLMQRTVKSIHGGYFLRLIVTILMLFMLSGISQAEELIIGLIPEQNVFKQMERYKPIGKYIEKKLGMEVRFIILSRYGNILNSFTKEKMDGAFWGSFTGALAIKQLGVQPIARPEWPDGTSTYHGYIFVRKDSGIRSVEDMKGKSIAFVEKATTAGYIFPLAYLKENGVNDIETYFKEYFFAGSHDSAVHAVYKGKADIGCAKNTIFNLVVDNDPNMKNDLLILESSPVVPSNGLGLRSDLDPAIKRKLQDALLGMHKDPEGKEALEQYGAARFIKTTKEDYAPIFDLAKKAGINMKKYRYLNR